MIPGRPTPLGWRGDPRPSGTAPLGMTKTPTLRSLLVCSILEAAPPLPGPALGVPEREVPSRLRPALTLDKPRTGYGGGYPTSLWSSLGLGGGQDPTCRRCPKTKGTCAGPGDLCLPRGEARAPSGGCERSKAAAPSPPAHPWVAGREVKPRLRPALTLDKPRIGGQDPTWRRGLPHGGTRAQALHSSAFP